MKLLRLVFFERVMVATATIPELSQARKAKKLSDAKALINFKLALSQNF